MPENSDADTAFASCIRSRVRSVREFHAATDSAFPPQLIQPGPLLPLPSLQNVLSISPLPQNGQGSRTMPSTGAAMAGSFVFIQVSFLHPVMAVVSQIKPVASRRLRLDRLFVFECSPARERLLNLRVTSCRSTNASSRCSGLDPNRGTKPGKTGGRRCVERRPGRGGAFKTPVRVCQASFSDLRRATK